jgi:tetratricopeptide (TPR) repeat protein
MLLIFACVTLAYDVERVREVEQLMQFRQFWDAYVRVGHIIKDERGGVNNYLYRIRAQCCLAMAMVQELMDETGALLRNRPSEEDARFAYALQARGYIQEGDYKWAERAAKESYDEGLIRDCRELVRMKSNAESHLKSGRLQEAASTYDQLLQHSPKCTPFFLERANISWDLRCYHRYKKLTASLVTTFPNFPTIAYRRGFISFCDGE